MYNTTTTPDKEKSLNKTLTFLSNNKYLLIASGILTLFLCIICLLVAKLRDSRKMRWDLSQLDTPQRNYLLGKGHPTRGDKNTTTPVDISYGSDISTYSLESEVTKRLKDCTDKSFQSITLSRTQEKKQTPNF